MKKHQEKRLGRPPTMEDPKNRILDEAAMLFARGGYEKSSLGELAVSIGMTKAAIYHYFQSKRDIYDAIIVRTLEGLTAYVREALKVEGTAENQLRRFMVAHATYFEANYGGFAAMLIGFGGMESGTLKAKAKRLRSSYEGILSDILQQGMSAGTFRKLDIRTANRAVLSLLNWMARWFEPGRGRSAASFAEEYFDMLIHGFARASQTARVRVDKSASSMVNAGVK